MFTDLYLRNYLAVDSALAIKLFCIGVELDLITSGYVNPDLKFWKSLHTSKTVRLL